MRQKPGDGIAALAHIAEQIEQRLFVRLPVGTEERDLRELFEEFGEVTECKVVNGKGCGFVTFTCWGNAHRALVETDGKVSMPAGDGSASKSQVLNVAFAEKKRGGGPPYTSIPLAKGLPNSRIFVGGLPKDTSEDELRNLFESYGAIKSASMIRSATKGRSPRCAFVTFALWGEALDAIAAVDNTRFPGGDRDDEDRPYLAVVLAEPPPGDSYEGSMNGKSAGTTGGLAPLPDPIFSFEKRRGAASPGGQRSEWEKLKAAYLETLESRSTREACDELHNALMAMRPSVVGIRPMGTAAGRVVVPPRPGAGAPAGPAAGRALSTMLATGVRPPKLVMPPGSRVTPAGVRSAAGSPAPFSFKGGRPPGPATDNRLFLSCLPPECNDEELRSLVEQISPELKTQSELLECRVIPHKGCGYLRWAKWQTTEEAIEALEERQVTGWTKALRAKWATPKEHGKGSGGAGSGYSTSYQPAIKDAPRSRAASRGDDSESPPWKKRRRGRSPSCRSRSPSSGSGSIRSARRSPQPRERSRSHDRTEVGADSTRLFIGMLQRHVGLDKVKRAFEDFGEIEDARYIEDKGVAYITYASPAAARKAIDEMADRDVPGLSRGGALNVQLAKSW